MTYKHGLIDIGSNTIRLVIYEYKKGRGFKQIENVKVAARIRNYLDKEGKSMMADGGSMVIETTEGSKWVGPGHCAVVRDGETDYLIFHAYDGESERFRSELKISTIVWENGWPRVATLP